MTAEPSHGCRLRIREGDRRGDADDATYGLGRPMTVCARCRRVMITTTRRCGMQLTCWEHCLRPTAAIQHWPGFWKCRGYHQAAGCPPLLSQLDRDEVAAINPESADCGGFGAVAVMPSLLAVHRRRRRTRLITWVASPAAAAVLAIRCANRVCRGPPRHRSGRPCRRCRRRARSCWRPRCRSAASRGPQPAVRLPGAAVCSDRWPWLWWS